MSNRHSEFTEVVLELIAELKGMKSEDSTKDVVPFMEETISRRELVRRVQKMGPKERTAFIQKVGPDKFLDTIRRRRGP